MSDAHAGHSRVELLAQRLRRTAARLAAIRRRNQLVDAVGSAETEEAAVDAVSDLLEVEPELATEVIEMPVKAFAQENVAALEQQTETLQSKLAALRSQR